MYGSYTLGVQRAQIKYSSPEVDETSEDLFLVL